MIKQIFKLFIFTQALFGWGKTGHRIVGEIAETYLTKNAKTQIKRLIGHHDLSRMSNWADFIKSDPAWKHANDWHWCTVPDGEDYVAGKHEGLAVEKVKEFIIQFLQGGCNGISCEIWEITIRNCLSTIRYLCFGEVRDKVVDDRAI